MSFKEMGLREEILQAIEEMGFEKPTDVQEKTIPFILEDERDLIALAQTGTGKTAGFGLPIINKIDTTKPEVQTLILCPTRELCMQITKDLQNFSKYLTNFKVVAVYGGASIEGQIRDIKKRPQIIVGTPGRSLDLIERKVLKVGGIKWFVLDEADEMLNMGFKEDLDAIFEETPSDKQTFLFSATMPKEIAMMGKRYMHNTEEIAIGKRNAGAENVEHYYYMAHAKDKYSALKRIVDVNPDIYGIIFCKTRKETKDISEVLVNDGYDADALHGDLSQAQRDFVMNKFRKKQLQILVATDVAARGLDVNNLTHVINFTLPEDNESYTHRSGRTGRAGKKGVSISIINMHELRKIRELEHKISKRFEKKMTPNGEEICEVQLFKLIDKIKNIEVNDVQIEKYLPMIFEKLEGLEREELIKKVVSMEFNKFLDYYKNSGDINVQFTERNFNNNRNFSDRPDRKDSNFRRASNSNFARIFVNRGADDNMNPARLIGAINEATNSRQIKIGKIDIKPKFSFIEVEQNSVEQVINGLSKVKVAGAPIKAELSKPRPDAKRANYGRF